jgi:hypothetical protein
MLITIHSYTAYITLAALIIAIVNAWSGLLGKRSFKKIDARINLVALIFSHLQLLLGLVMYFTAGYFNTLLETINNQEMGMSHLMKTESLRKMLVEHPLSMIIAIALITIGYSRHKKKSGKAKFKTIGIFFSIGLIIILAAIQWRSWLGM